MTQLGPEAGRPTPAKMLARAMDDRIEKTATCWIWRGYILQPAGYGRFHAQVDGVFRGVLAHRLIYEQLVGPIPPGMTLDHLCRVRACVNPDHLEVVSQRTNVQRGEAGRYERRKA